MTWLFLTFGCLLSVEVALRLPFAPTVKKMIEVSSRAVHAIAAASVSDHWKERAMCAYSIRLGTSSLLLATYIALALTPFFAVVGLLGLSFDEDILELVSSWQGITYITAVAVGFGFIRTKYVR